MLLKHYSTVLGDSKGMPIFRTITPSGEKVQVYFVLYRKSYPSVECHCNLSLLKRWWPYALLENSLKQFVPCNLTNNIGPPLNLDLECSLTRSAAVPLQFREQSQTPPPPSAVRGAACGSLPPTPSPSGCPSPSCPWPRWPRTPPWPPTR